MPSGLPAAGHPATSQLARVLIYHSPIRNPQSPFALGANLRSVYPDRFQRSGLHIPALRQVNTPSGRQQLLLDFSSPITDSAGPSDEDNFS